MNKLLLPLLFSITIAVNAQNKNKTEKLDSLFTQKYEDKSFNGNVLIAEKGKVIFKKASELPIMKRKDF